MNSLDIYWCRGCENHFATETSKAKPLCCPFCFQQKDFVFVKNVAIDMSPCKIGDKAKATVYRPYNGHDATIYGEVISMSKDKKIIRVLYNGCRTIDFYDTDFGKTIFIQNKK